jgi:hypothetical protein
VQHRFIELKKKGFRELARRGQTDSDALVEAMEAIYINLK